MNKNNTCSKCGSILNEQGICIYCENQKLLSKEEITTEDMLKTLEKLGFVEKEEKDEK